MNESQHERERLVIVILDVCNHDPRNLVNDIRRLLAADLCQTGRSFVQLLEKPPSPHSHGKALFLP